MTLPPTYSVATRPAVGDAPAVTVAYRRCTVRDLMQVAQWVQVWQGGGDPEELAGGELRAACEAMAGRLMLWPDGEAWTDAELVDLHGVDTGLWAWLYGLLFWPALDGGRRLESLRSALRIAPVADGGGCPGDPASTDCRVCLEWVHSTWSAGRGAPTGQPYPVARQLGDAICEACPKWAVPGRPTLGASDLALARLIIDMRTTGGLPDAGGLLDQDADVWERVGVIAASPWFAVWGA